MTDRADMSLDEIIKLDRIKPHARNGIRKGNKFTGARKANGAAAGAKRNTTRKIAATGRQMKSGARKPVNRNASFNKPKVKSPLNGFFVSSTNFILFASFSQAELRMLANGKMIDSLAVLLLVRPLNHPR